MRRLTVGIWLLLPVMALGQSEPVRLPELIIKPQPSITSELKWTTFDANRLVIKRESNRFQLWDNKQQLKDFGPNEKEAQDALRVLRELGVNQYVTIPGSKPVFECWLLDGKPISKRLSHQQTLSFDPKLLKLEKMVGVWVIRDHRQVLFNFGSEEQKAKQALALLQEHKFNVLGIIGAPNPSMTYFLTDGFQINQVQPGNKDGLLLAESVDKMGLVLPTIGYVGPKILIDPKKLELIREQGQWLVRLDKEVLAKFGSDERAGQDFIKILTDGRVTEVARIGKSGIPLYLSNGQPLRRVPLGIDTVPVQTKWLKVSAGNQRWFLSESNRMVLDTGEHKDDAELMLKVIQYYNLNLIAQIGRPFGGGTKLLLKGR